VKPRSLIVVDDDPVFTGAASRVLSRAGYEVLTAQTLSAARELLNSRVFDAVITDLSLDGTRGFEGLEVAKLAKARNPNVKVILITAHGSDEVERRAAESGVDLKLDKPVSLAFLKQVLTDSGLGRTERGRAPSGPRARPAEGTSKIDHQGGECDEHGQRKRQQDDVRV